jgi:hypothetical protein
MLIPEIRTTKLVDHLCCSACRCCIYRNLHIYLGCIMKHYRACVLTSMKLTVHLLSVEAATQRRTVCVTQIAFRAVGVSVYP